MDISSGCGATQAYSSMLERGERALSSEVASRMIEVFKVPGTVLPIAEYQTRTRDASIFQTMPGSLGYPGFAFLGASVLQNPTELLMEDAEQAQCATAPHIPMKFRVKNWRSTMQDFGAEAV